MDNKEQRKEELYSQAIPAGKRRYFFDVKETRGGDKFITITESRKLFDNNTGDFFFEKNKMFLYKEDFEKFREGLDEVITYIKDTCFGGTIPQREPDEGSVEFEDL